jgi:hypothetical protein
MTIKKIAVIRQDSRLPCPFGLPIADACFNAGDSVERMAPLEFFDADEHEKYSNANRKIYLYHATGERCSFADKIVKAANVVHCDFQDGGEGLKDTPMRASPYYARVFNGLANNAGGGISGLVAYPLNSYWENMEAQQIFSSMLTMFASNNNVEITKDSDSKNVSFLDLIAEDE